MDIKFRAWDKVNNKMYKVERLYFSQDDLITNVGIDCDKTKGEFQVIDIKFINLLQYVGKDCKDNEAYEGDILKEWSNYTRDFKNTSYGIIKREKDTCNLYIEWHACDGYGDILLKNVSKFLIVGNIYQNKDLLKGED